MVAGSGSEHPLRLRRMQDKEVEWRLTLQEEIVARMTFLESDRDEFNAT